jgi:hypothetical protein
MQRIVFSEQQALDSSQDIWLVVHKKNGDI